MKLRVLITLLVVALAGLKPLAAQEPPEEVQAFVTQVKAKLAAGKRTPADLAPELATLDGIIKKFAAEKKTELAAQGSFMRAGLYLQVFDDAEKAKALLKDIKKDFPETEVAKEVDAVLAGIEQEAKAKELAAALIGKPAPDLHFTWTSAKGGPKSLADLKGKVVVIDFWATWCGPCIRSFPEVRQLVEHYKGSDVVVLGVTSLQGRVVNLEAKPIDTSADPEKEKALMNDFIKKHDMTWTVAFSEEKVFNPDYFIEGIPHMSIIAPDGTLRHNDLHPAAPHEEKTAKIDAILKEFKLAVPAAKKS